MTEQRTDRRSDRLTDGPTGRTNELTDGQSLKKRCVSATKKPAGELSMDPSTINEDQKVASNATENFLVPDALSVCPSVRWPVTLELCTRKTRIYDAAVVIVSMTMSEMLRKPDVDGSRT